MTPEDISKLTFEQGLAALENIVRKLELGKDDLETSIKDYEIGNLLKNHCDKKLKDAELKIQKLMQNNGGVPEVVDGSNIASMP